MLRSLGPKCLFRQLFETNTTSDQSDHSYFIIIIIIVVVIIIIMVNVITFRTSNVLSDFKCRPARNKKRIFSSRNFLYVREEHFWKGFALKASKQEVSKVDPLCKKKKKKQ